MLDEKTTEVAEETFSSDADILADVTEEIDKTEEEEETEEKIETKPEDEEEEGKIEDEEDDLEKLKIPFDRPTVKEIKTKYPNLFKDFPQLRESYFKELQYTSLFPSIEDAKEAFDDVESFSTLRESALGGDPGPLLESLEASDKKALGSFARNFLPKLYQKNSDLYREVTTPIIENLIRHVHAAGVKNSNEDLTNSALNISKYLFDTDEIATGKKTFVKEEEKPKQDEEKVREQAARLNAAYVEVQNNIHASMRKLILADLDPNKVFNPFMRRQIVEEVISRIGKALQADTGHMKVMGSRWKRAELNGYSEEEKSKIITTYLARAKSLIPSVREKVRAAALGTKNKDAADKTRRVEQVTRRDKEITGGRAPGSRDATASRNGKVDYSKMSDLDILNEE